jgi:nucleoside-diphosphate-sugar epimerase
MRPVGPQVLLIGAGWLGQQLISSLLQAGCQVTATRRQAGHLSSLPAGVAGLCWDGVAPPDQCLRQAAARAVIICAVPPGRRSGAPEAYLQTLQWIAELAGTARALLFCSTTSVFSGCSGLLHEQSPLSQSAAASVVVRAEQLALSAGNTNVIRLGGLIGPGRHPARFCQYGPLQGPELPVNLIHAADVCQALTLLVLQPLPAGQVVHLVAPHHPTKQVFYQHACRLAGVAAPTFAAPTEPARRIASCLPGPVAGFKFIYPDLLLALQHCD